MKKEKYYGLSHRIARWKLDNPFENWLGFRADNSKLFKKLYVLYYYLFDRKYYVAGVEMASNAIKNHASGKGIPCMDDVVRDMIYCLHRFGISFQDYCIYDFAHNYNFAYRDSFVADKLRYHYCDLLNTAEIYQIMTNKYSCYKEYGEFYQRDMIGCFSDNDNAKFIEFVSNHSEFIYKPLDEHSGHGIEIFQSGAINPSFFYKEKLAKGPFVLEELIEQGEETARMHPQSVNSCRMLTFTIGKEVTLIGSTWRVGSGGAVKDNAGSGGMYAYINPQTGIVETDAINYHGEHFKLHPDTNYAFEGYQMPCWNDAVSMVRAMATKHKGSTLIAWDIAYSRKGWVMVEANENGDWSIIQSNKKKGMKSMLLNLMDEYFKSDNNAC